MSSRLAEIVRRTRADLERRRVQTPEKLWRSRAGEQPKTRDFAAAIRRGGSSSPLRVIGELKRRSPSAGAIYEDLDVVESARSLERAGCAALSVLTEPHFFGGSSEALVDARAAVELPLLRKDFLLEPYQIVEARALGADAVLLLAAVLDDDTLARLWDEARRWDMAVLAEAHGEDELERLLRLGFPIVGLNARDLHSFEVDLERPLAWVHQVPRDRVCVAESGIRDRAAADRIAAAPFDAVLIGEGLMRGGDPSARFVELFGRE